MASKKKIAKKDAARSNVQLAEVKDSPKPPPEAIAIMAKTEDLAGQYSNVAIFKHTSREFVADFLWRMDNTSLLVSRIIMSPQHAKAVQRALGQNIGNYEEKFGEIKEVDKTPAEGGTPNDRSKR